MRGKQKVQEKFHKESLKGTNSSQALKKMRNRKCNQVHEDQETVNIAEYLKRNQIKGSKG